MISPNGNPEMFEYCNRDKMYKLNLVKFMNSIEEFPHYLCDGDVGKNLEYPFGELELNAGMHGNKKDPELPYHLKIGAGYFGYVFQFEDCGEGFDIQKKLIQKQRNEKYYDLGGVGLDVFDTGSNMIVSYGGKGNIANLMYKDLEIEE